MRPRYKRICSTTDKVHITYEGDEGRTLCGREITKHAQGQKNWLYEGYEDEMVTCKTCFKTYGFDLEEK